MSETEKWRECKGFSYELLEDGTARIALYHGNKDRLVIPSELKGHPVSEIGTCAFFGQVDLKSVTFPESLRRIGSSVFLECDSLTSIVLPEGLVSLEGGAFAECISLYEVTLPKSLTQISISPFPTCYRLTEIHLPDDHPVLALVDGALINRAEKKVLFCPCVFNGSSDFKGSIADVLQDIQVIGEYAFERCIYLDSVVIPESVTSIMDYAFSGCENLRSITIPPSVTHIGKNAFIGCKSLKVVVKQDSYADRHFDDSRKHYYRGAGTEIRKTITP